jgi:hypothetical protein
VVVPQNVYVSLKRGKVFVAQYPIILFTHSGRGMMPLRNAQDENYEGLQESHRLVLEEFGSKISLRLLVRNISHMLAELTTHYNDFSYFKIKGYKSSCCQIRVKDGCRPPKPITLGKLSTEIAKFVKKFIEV